ncbi:hypothetical protein [Hyalangium versicolor]|uniref:hypothetical protein n=1 Tax=Hyalangium versicolor TaxID=2861190 RepID=UPI001CCA5D07|nr:hypothetical protein [Hyalangium versicolor]
MLHIHRIIVLLVLVASATVARAEEPVSPVPLLVAKEGSVVYMDSNGPRILAECLETMDHRMLAGPKKGQFERRSHPCGFWSLAVHPPTGRWAAALQVTGDQGANPSPLVSFVVSGRTLSVPTDKAGRAKGGNFLVLGDLNGIVAITPGTLETWTEKGRFFAQMPAMFTEDGSRVLVSISDTTLTEWWSWSFGPRPESVRVLPRGMTDTAGNMVLSGEPRTALRHGRGGVRLATLDPTGKKPWKVGPALPQVRRGMLTPAVLGDTMLFYREGSREETDCEGPGAGTYRRIDLRTGQERVWRRHEGWCSTGDRFDAVSPVRRTVYFLESWSPINYPRLFEYDVERDTTRQIPVESVSRVKDISADGRTLLLFAGSGFVLYDVVADSATPLRGLGEADYVRLLAQP